MRFEEFVEDLRVLQDGTFEASLTLWLKLAIETEELIKPSPSKYSVKQTSSLQLTALNFQSEMLSMQKMT